MTRQHDDAGQIAGMEGVIFGVLVFVFGTLVLANAWGVIDAKSAASAAAREATRAFVESTAATTDDALVESERAAVAAIEGHGRSRERMTLVPVEGALERCARVTMRVEYRVRLAGIPLLSVTKREMTTTATHSEIVDPYRAGLPPGPGCPAELQP